MGTQLEKMLVYSHHSLRMFVYMLAFLSKSRFTALAFFLSGENSEQEENTYGES